VLVRYADDFVVLCRSESAAKESQRRLGIVMEHLHLQMHPEKTRIVALHQGQAGFYFLGFHHRLKESWRRRGHWYLHKWPSPRAMKAIRQKVKDTLAPRHVLSNSLHDCVRALNPVLRGWAQYFRVGTSSRQFALVDEYVFLRLTLFDQAKHQRHYRGWRGQRIPDLLKAAGLYRLGGTVRYSTRAHALT
jgi:hypothetical protein